MSKVFTKIKKRNLIFFNTNNDKCNKCILRYNTDSCIDNFYRIISEVYGADCCFEIKQINDRYDNFPCNGRFDNKRFNDFVNIIKKYMAKNKLDLE